MPTILFPQQAPYPKIILSLRFLVLFASIVYAGLFDLAASGVISFFPNFLLLSPSFGLSWLFQPFTSALTITYPGFGLSMVFDLLLINFFLTPIFTFVLTFLTGKHFLRLLISFIGIGAGTFYAIAALLAPLTPPCSLFSGICLAIVIFWALLHRKGQSTLLLAFPISRTWAIALSAFVTLYNPVTNGEWARIGAIIVMSAIAYLWGVARWRLRSHLEFLEKFELWLDSSYRTIARFTQWYVLRPLRIWFHIT